MRDLHRSKLFVEDKAKALVRARRIWQDTAADVSRSAITRHGTRSAWLADHAGRPHKGVKAADQLVRLVQEMTDANYSPDQQDAALMQMVRGIRTHVAGTRPAA